MYPTVTLSSEDLSTTIPTSAGKDAFRNSIGSQSSTTTTTTASTTSQRHSVTSLDIVLENQQTQATEVEQLVNSSRSTLRSLSPSSRFLLSGATTSENFRNQVLSRFYPTSHHQKSLSDPFVVSSVTNVASNQESCGFDPWCTPLQNALEKSIYSDLMDKYEAPSFAFAKCWKRRHFVLVEHVVLLFKPLKPTYPAREHFILTEDTLVFVTEDFKKGYIIEARKPLSKWYIRCNSTNQMKTWLELMKKIVACIKIGYSGVLSNQILASFTLTDGYKIRIPSKTTEEKRKHRQSLPLTTIQPLIANNVRQSNSHKPRLSLSEIPGWESTLPPAMPPPRSKPPSVPPSALPTVSE